jgi:hypothetical protein
MYQGLEAVQGEVRLVHLGNINLVKEYEPDLGVRIAHVVLMPEGGETVGEADMPNLKQVSSTMKSRLPTSSETLNVVG